MSFEDSPGVPSGEPTGEAIMEVLQVHQQLSKGKAKSEKQTPYIYINQLNITELDQ